MKINKIILENYRQYKNVELNFDKNCDCDLHIFIGKNGTGKTNLLNAVNWCLYEDEPHLARESQQLPLINLKNLDKNKESYEKTVSVEIWLKIKEKDYAIFTRKWKYRIHNDKNLSPIKKEFRVKRPDSKGNMKILSEKEAEIYVKRFIPSKIREFFFFDGERLDKYFREATSQNIRHSILDISKIDLLERIVDRLSKMSNELEKSAGKINPQIESISKELNAEKDNLEDIQNHRMEVEKQLEEAENKIEEYDGKLRGVPNIQKLQSRIDDLKRNNNEKVKLYKRKLEKKRNIIFEYGKYIMTKNAIVETISIIKQKREKGDIPPNVNKNVLEESLEQGNCNICGRKLNAEAQKHMEKILKDVKTSTEINKKLVNMESPLQKFYRLTDEFQEKINEINGEIEHYEDEIKGINKEIKDINSEISGYDKEKVKKWYKEKENFKEIKKKNNRIIGNLETEEKNMKKKIDKLEKQLKKEMKKDKRNKDLKKQMDFCEKALNIVEHIKVQIMNETRENIELETNRLFFNLLWKKSTFKDINIDGKYNINVIHEMGYKCLGTLGAAERELLMLSFTLALHQVSGFDSPILIDTPVARVSDEHRENLSKVFAKIGKHKQLILLFTPAEYSSEISKLVDKHLCSKQQLKLISEEKEVKVEDLQ